VWFLSLPGKYLPGKLAYLGGRIFLHEDRGVSRKTVTLCLYLESLAILFSSLVVVCISVPFADLIFPDGFVYVALASLGVLLPFIHPALIRRVFVFLAGKWAIPKVELDLSGPELSKFMLGHILNQGAVAGMFFFALMRALSPGGDFSLLTAAAINNAVGVSAMILFIFPAGIGVREGLYVFLMTRLLPPPAPVVVAIMARLLITVVEVGSAFSVFTVGIFTGSRDKVKLGSQNAGSKQPPPSS